MAPRPGPVNSGRFAVQGTLEGVNWANIFWCSFPDLATLSQIEWDGYTDLFGAHYKTNFGPHLHTGVFYTSIRAVAFQGGGFVVETDRPLTGQGSEASASIQNSATSKVISWNSGVYWRGGKPRTYLPGGSQAEAQDGNNWAASVISSLTTAANGFMSAINSQPVGTLPPGKLGFVSYKSGGQFRPLPLFFQYTGAVVHPRIGSQRRRLGPWIA